jgi:glutathione reductase (NADPH)
LAASISEALKDAKDYGFSVSHNGFHWNLLKQKRDAYIQRLNGIYANNIKKDNVEHIHGKASFVDRNTIQVNGQHYSAKHILIASGSYAWIPDLPGCREFGVTSDGFFEMAEAPKNVAVIGAGYIAVELVGIFHALGIPVTLFIRHGEFLRSFDSMIRKAVMEEYKKAGIKIVDHASVVKIENKGTSSDWNLSLHVKCPETEMVHSGYDKVIWAVGREAKTEDLNLSALGISLNPQGFIIADEWQNTNVPNVHALGDVCGKAMLTPGNG